MAALSALAFAVLVWTVTGLVLAIFAFEVYTLAGEAGYL